MIRYVCLLTRTNRLNLYTSAFYIIWVLKLSHFYEGILQNQCFPSNTITAFDKQFEATIELYSCQPLLLLRK